MIRKNGSKYELRTKDGKHVLGTHPSKEAARRQEAAINISKARAAGHRVPKK